MHIETFSYNSKEELAANTYVISNSKNEAIVIDPSCDYDGIINYLINHKLKLVAIFLTHGHFDHLKGVNRLVKHFRVQIYCNPLEEPLLTDSELNCSNNFSAPIIVEAKPQYLKDQDTFKFGDQNIVVLHTPYHTLGSNCYYFEKEHVLFSGDSLFKMSIGRDDLITSCPEYKHESLNKLKNLPEDTKVYPGHGNSTVLKNELLFNRFFNR